MLSVLEYVTYTCINKHADCLGNHDVSNTVETFALKPLNNKDRVKQFHCVKLQKKWYEWDKIGVTDENPSHWN